MPTLASELRNKLERVVIGARDAAEAGARAALEALAVHHHEPFQHMKPAQRELRNHLRARARQLGDRQDASGRLAIDHLIGECAYEHWHRMLFARFLAENGLLIEPQENMAISLAEAEELAKEDGVDVWVFASRCAQRMLPQIFRPDDPLLQVSFATEHMLKLEKLLASLPQAVFTASDALGWVYQFWQSKKKDEINRSEVKIGADEISAVTQLFTEPYMVAFLLHNTLGAWWAGKVAAAGSRWSSCTSESDCRRLCALPGLEWNYLRFIRVAAASSRSVQEKRQDAASTWRPVAGTLDGWPKTTAELRVLDPCCGSGHFLVAALHHLAPIRMAEEGLSAAEAVDAVLRNNLHGLEIDERCCQIAAFALAFAAWTYPEAGGYRPLPELHIACTGIGPQSTKEQWLRLAEEAAERGGMPAKRDLFGTEDSLLSASVKGTLEALHELFAQAPVLGSLINPANLRADLFHAEYKAVAPLLSAVLDAQSTTDETREWAIAAAGMVKAADLLAGEYTLVITNVPYLGRGKQHETLKAHLEKHYKEGKADLATAFVLRCLQACAEGSSTALVTPQNWLFLSSYRRLREELLSQYSWNFAVNLGPNAFKDMNWWAATTALSSISSMKPTKACTLAGFDSSGMKDPDDKAAVLAGRLASSAAGNHDGFSLRITIGPVSMRQQDQLSNPDARIVVGERSTLPLLSQFAVAHHGLTTGDTERMQFAFWELDRLAEPWMPFCGSCEHTTDYGGRSSILRWHGGGGPITEIPGARLDGQSAWAQRGVLIRQMRHLPATLYEGDPFDNNTAVLIPRQTTNLATIWAFVTSPDYPQSIRRVDQKVSVTSATLGKVPFDLAHWQKVAAEKYPNGLPEPESDDPTQWLFHGYPGGRVAEASSLWSGDLSQGSSATIGYFDPDQPISNLTGDLPHWRQEGATYFLTFRCADAMPQEKLDQWRREMAEWKASHPEPQDEATRWDFYERFPARLQAWLDAGYGSCPFRDAENRRIVEAAINHFNGERYDIVEYVVAANHVHVIVTPLPGHELSDVLHSWKSFTANQLNKRLNRFGAFWQKESFDHIVRSPKSLELFCQYIREHDGVDKVAAAFCRRFQSIAQRQDASATHLVAVADVSATHLVAVADASATHLVAVARLLGYRWPAEQGGSGFQPLDQGQRQDAAATMRLSKRARALVKRCDELAKFAYDDGIVCIPSVRGEEPAAERLLALLGGCGISPQHLSAASAAGSRSHLDLDDWLRNRFFEEHCKLFHERPFVWHIWDGRKATASAPWSTITSSAKAAARAASCSSRSPTPTWASGSRGRRMA